MATTKQDFVRSVDGGINTDVSSGKTQQGQLLRSVNFRPKKGYIEQTAPIVPYGDDFTSVYTDPFMFIRVVREGSSYKYVTVSSAGFSAFDTDFSTNTDYICVRQVLRPNVENEFAECLLYTIDPADFSSVNDNFEVEITSSTQYRWRKNGGSWSGNITIVAGPNTIGTGSQIYFMTTSGFTPGYLWKWERSFGLNVDERVTADGYKDYVFFANVDRGVFVLQDGTVRSVGYSKVFGKYCAFYQNHLIIGQYAKADASGADTFDAATTPWRLAWSDLDDPDQFFDTTGTPLSLNEADAITLPAGHFPDSPIVGITGLVEFGNFCFIFLHNSIYAMSYVGLPLVMRIEPIVQGFGNIFSHTVVRSRRGIYFISSDNFYFFDGSSQPRAIGDNVKTTFFNELLPVDDAKYDWIYGKLDEDRNEVVWTYWTRVYNDGVSWFYQTKQVIFQEETGKWFFRNLPNQDTDSSVEQIRDWCKKFQSFEQLVYSGTGQFYKDFEASVDAREDIIPDTFSESANSEYLVDDELVVGLGEELIIPSIAGTANPLFETQDFFYDNPALVKELDSLFLDAWLQNFPNTQIRLFCAVRDTISEPLTPDLWRDCGVWNNSTEEKRFSLPREAGRVVRYRFQLEDTTNTPVHGIVVQHFQEFLNLNLGGEQ